MEVVNVSQDWQWITAPATCVQFIKSIQNSSVCTVTNPEVIGDFDTFGVLHLQRRVYTLGLFFSAQSGGCCSGTLMHHFGTAFQTCQVKPHEFEVFLVLSVFAICRYLKNGRTCSWSMVSKETAGGKNTWQDS